MKTFLRFPFFSPSDIIDAFTYAFQEYQKLKEFKEINKTKREKIKKAITLLKKYSKKKSEILDSIFTARMEERRYAKEILLSQIDRVLKTDDEDEIKLLALLLETYVEIVNSPVLKEEDEKAIRAIALDVIEKFLEDDEIIL